MAMLLISPPSLSFKNPNPNPNPIHSSLLRSPNPHSLTFSRLPKTTTTTAITTSTNPRSPSFRSNATGEPTGFVDEWGEKSGPETEPPTKLPDADPPKDEDEWGGAGSGDGYVLSGNGSPSSSAVEGAASAVEGAEDDKLAELKRCLADTVYGTDLGFGASPEVRAEVSELVNQLEAANPTPAPMEASGVLDGNWILLYTASSELLPLLAIGTTPLLKVERICQAINTSTASIDNTITFASPFATFSVSASASFEVRSPSRIQVEFREGTFQPPAIKSSIDLPENVDVFGQSVNLSPLQQSLSPLQDAVVGLVRAISGQPPLKVPIPGERTKSWLLTTYLDKDLRISRGDGGLFVLAKEGSPLVEN